MTKKIFMRFPGGKAKALTLSYDDGTRYDRTLVDILDRYGLKCTFNVNSGIFGTGGQRRLSAEELMETYSKGGHEIACHGAMHPHLEQLPPVLATADVFNDRLALEKLTGHSVRGMAYPYGSYNEAVVEILRNCGIVYSRTTVSTENFRMPTDWLRLPATCHHTNPRLMDLAKNFVEADNRSDAPLMFYLWGHSYEFNDSNNWNVIEDFAKFVGGKEEIWYATNIEIYDYVEDYYRLIWMVDGSAVQNPTARDIYLNVDQKDYMIPAGKAVKIGE